MNSGGSYEIRSGLTDPQDSVRGFAAKPLGLSGRMGEVAHLDGSRDGHLLKLWQDWIGDEDELAPCSNSG